MGIIRLGSMYLDGQTQDLPFSCQKSTNISLGNTVPGKEIEWVKEKGILVATQCVCVAISWEQLDQLGFVFGRTVQIDGKPYLCRCLKVGAEDDGLNEWDDVLSKWGSGNDLWNWEHIYFWGQETPLWSDDGLNQRVVRGFSSPYRRNSVKASHQLTYVGFRPVLVPLFSGNPQILVCSNIKLFGPRGETITGDLAECDDYDFVLDPILDIPANCGWASWIGGQVIVQRGNVIGIKEAKYDGEN